MGRLWLPSQAHIGFSEVLSVMLNFGPCGDMGSTVFLLEMVVLCWHTRVS